MFWIILETLGILLAASTVRMVAGTTAGIVALTVIVLNQAFAGGSAFLFPLALLLLVLLRVGGLRHLKGKTLLVCGCLSLCCLWTPSAFLLIPAAACAFLFQVLLPNSGNAPWRELFERSKHLPWQLVTAFSLVVTVPLMLAGFRGLSLTPLDIHTSYIFLGLALIALIWLLFGLREADGAVVTLAGLPLSCMAVDPSSARSLLFCVVIIVAALSLKNYRIKRAAC